MSNTTATQILFIDSRVADADVLLAGLDPAVEIVRLNATESGLQQMANAVQGRSNISSVHVISHGGSGNLLLGSGLVNQSQLAAEQLALSTLQSALSEDADLLLYGCDVAAGAEGQSFINALAAATGADVAASTDLTGGGSAQSDWELESSTGAIETAAIDPVGYQYDLGYWGNVGLTNGDRWNVYRGSQYTVIFDADGGGKGSKYGVANNVGAYNVSNLYTSGYNGDWEAIWYTFTGSSTAVPGSPWYVSNWDPDAGGYTYWGAYANSTPWQVTGRVDLNQGQSQTLFVGNLVRDDYYSSGDIWKYLVGASAGGYVSSSSLSIGNSSAKYATFYAPDVQSWKGTVYLGSITYSVNDGVDYSRGGSLNPDYYSAYSRYKSATYTTAVYGTYVDDAIVWSSAPTNQTWSNQTRNTVNYGRGAVEPDAADYVTGYHLMNITDVTGGGSTNLGTSLPGSITASGANGNTLSVKNLAPEFANKTYQLTVEARSSADVAGTGDDYLTKVQKQFTITTGTVNQLNDLPTSPGNTLTVREDRALVLSAADFNFVDLDNTVGGSSATGARLENVRITSVPANGALKLFATASGPTVTVTTQGASGVKEVVTAAFSAVTTETVIKLGTTVAKVVAGATAEQVAQAVAYELNNDKFSLFTATASSGTVTLTAKTTGVMTDLESASFKVLDNPGAALAADAVVTAAQLPNLVFIPTADFSGSTSFGYKVNDGYADALSASTMNLSVTAVNDLPVFTSDSASPVTVNDKAASGIAIDAVSGVLSATDPEGTTVRYGIDGGVLNYSGSAVYTAPTLTVATAGASTVAQVTDVTFAASTQATTVLFNKTTIKLGASDTAIDVATKVATAISANTAEEFTATAAGAVVTLTAKVTGARAELSAADFGYQTLSRQGQYGVITVDQLTGKWVYTPTQTAAINQLKVDETATEVFGLTATDAAGQAAGKALTITIDGENSVPYLANALADTTLNSARQYKLPSDAFKDVDGNTLTLSASIGGTSVPATNNSGLSFNAATGTFTAEGTATGSSTTPQTIVVTATDSVTGAAVATDEFVLGNTAPIAAKPLPYKIIKTSSEVTTVTFAAPPAGATSITFDGVPIDISSATTAEQVATAMADGTYSNFTITASGPAITVTAKAAGNSADITASDFVYSGPPASAAVSAMLVTPPVNEITKFTYSGGGPLGITSVTFDGLTRSTSEADRADGSSLAAFIANSFGPATANYEIRAGIPGTDNPGDVFVTPITPGQQTSSYPFVLTGSPAPSSVATVVTRLGVNETTDFWFANRSDLSTVVFDGSAAIDISAATTGAQIAAAIVGALSASGTTNYTVSQVASTNQIKVIARTLGDKTDLDYSSFSFTTTFASAATVGAIVQGGAWSYEIPSDTFTDANGDPLTVSVFGPYQDTAPAVSTAQAGSGSERDVTEVDFTSATVPAKIRFEKQIVTISGVTPTAVDVVSALVTSINANASSLYTAAVGSTASKLVLTTKEVGAGAADPVISDFATLLTATTPIAYNSGTLSGSGDQPASQFTVVATDGSASSSNTFTLQTYSTTPPTLPSAVDIEFSGAGDFSYTIPSEAFHLSTAQTFTKSGTWPAWANIVNGKIVGNPSASDEGSYALVVQGTSRQVTFNVSVSDANDPMVLANPISAPTIGQGVTNFSQSVSGTFTDADHGSTITYQAYADKNRDGDYADAGEQLASTGTYWLKFNGTSFTGTPDEALSSVNVKLVATSSDGSTDSTTFKINLPTNEAGSLSAITVSGGNATAGALTETNSFTAGNVIYKWQSSTDAGTTWVDVASDGSRTVNASTLALLPSEVGTQLRVNAYYTDTNGFSETVSSAASALIDHTDVANQPGALSLVGDLKPGYTLFANVTDPNGLATVPTYVWCRSDNDATFTEVISGVTGNSYTLTSADSYKYIKVIASYQDKTSGATLTVSAISNDPTDLLNTATDYVGLDATAPVAVNDGASITENSGLLNATVASGSAAPKTGNLFTNDTDANAKTKAGVDITAKRDLFELTDLRTGSLEGDGTQGRKVGTDAVYTFKLKGQYGWLEVTNSGAYSYYLDQNNATVQGLTSASANLTDVFNYEINDGDAPELLSDVGTLTLTIAGANDLPTITGGIGRSSNAPVGSAVADTTAPVLSSSSVNGNKLVLKFSEGLASSDLPAASSFVVSVGGSAVTVSSVAASGSTVVLTLASAVTNGQVVTVSYTDATAGNDTVALQDNNGNDVATITSASVVNKTPPATDNAAPAFVSAVLVADQLKLTFSELLNSANLPHEADFTISVNSVALTWRDYRVVGVEDDVLTIQLNTAVTSPTAPVTVTYQDWSAGNDVNAIQDLAGNDLPSLAAVSVTNQTVAVAAETFSANVSEDVASFLNTGGLVFADPDSTDITVKIVANNGARLVVPAAMTNVTVWGSDTSALILKGTASALNAALAGDSVQYITSPNGTSSGNTVTISASDDGGSTFTEVVTTNIAIDGKNDSIKLDLDTTSATNGYGYVALFRPRGEAVKISNANSTITDADGTEITSATIRIASGAVDNEFGTIFETLSSSLGTTETFTWEGLTVTGNGTTDINVTGLATHARYKELIDSISYINANPNAYGGDRQVTIRLTDKYAVESEQLESNSALLVLATANSAVQVGQRIFIGARNADDTAWVYTDTLATVATVVNSTHFIASNNLPLLTPSSAIRFVSTGSVASSVTNTSITLGSVNGSVAAGQKIYTTAGVEIGTVSSVSGSVVNITSTYGALAVGTTIIFETEATSSVTQTSANRTVDSITSSASSSSIVLNTIDLSIQAGQVIYEGSDVRGVVASVSFSGASGGSTTVTTKAVVSGVIATDTLVFKTFATNLTPTATTTIRNVWTTEVDLNGVLETGRDYTAVFAEGQNGGTPIAASSASLDNQSVFVKTVVITLANATDGASGGDENLFLNPAYVTALLGRGITYALSNNDHTLTLSAINQSAGVTAADMQLALRAVQYENLSQNPSVTPRIVNVTVTDITNTLTNTSLTGVAARTTINITPSNDAPTLAGDFAAAVLEGGAYTLTTGDLSPSDIDNDITTLRYEVTSASSSITVFRDINGDGQVDAGEAIAVRNGSTAGQEFTQAEVIAGNIKVKQNGTDVPIIGLTETEAENLVNSAVYTNAAANPSAGLRQVIFQTSTQMSSLGSAGTPLGQQTVALETGTKTVDGVTYAVVMSGSGASSVATLTVSKTGAGFTEQEVQAIVASLRYGNTASTPTSGDPTVSLSGVVTLTGTTVDTPTVVSTVSSVMASATEANAFDSSDVTAVNAVLATGKNVAQLEFKVTNVSPDDAEYLKLLGSNVQVDVTGNASDLFTGIDLSTPAAGDSYKTLSFKVTGVSDGVNETITFGSGSTSHVVPLVVGSVVKDGVIYSVTAGSSATERLLTVTKPFAAIGLALRDNGENGVLPVAASMNLTVTPVNDAPTFSATVAGGTFTEGGANRTLFSAAAITDGDTSGAEQDITELKLTITGVRDGSAEKLVVGGQTISLTSGAVVGGGLGYAVTVAGSTATVTLTKTDSASAWATLINGMAYQNTSNAPTNGNRVVTLTSLKDSGGTTNGGADTKALNLASTVTVQGIDTAPVVTSNGATVQSGGLLTITSASPVMLTATDADSSSDTLVYTLTSSTAKGTLFLDKNGNSDVDEGETLVASTEFTQTDLDNGTLKYFHTGNVGADAFSFRVKDATTTLSPSTFDITVSAAGGVTGSGTSTANSTDGSDTLFQQVAITTNSGESVKTLTFKVSGATDGSAEYLTVNGQDVPLTAGTTTVSGVTYTVVDDGAGNFTVSVTSAAGFDAIAANAIVNGASYGNDAVPPSSGERAISLATVTTTNGSSTFTTATNIGAVTTIAPTVDVFTDAQAQAAIASPGANNDIKALTFTVSGVKDGANEVIKINGQEIALVAGAPVVIDGVTYQVTASTPAGTFIVTMTDATGPGLTEAQAEAIVAGVTLSNSDSTPTDGARSVSLSNYSVGLASGTTIASITSVNGSSIEPLSGAVLSSTTDVDVLTFSVSGVLDGNNEVLLIGGVSVPLVTGTVTNAQGTYVVSVSSGVATVVFTPAAPLSNSDAQNLVRAVDYLNTATPVSPGERTVNLVSLSDSATTTPIAQSVTGNVNVAAVVGSTSSISSTTAVNGASVEPLSGAVISSAANIDVLTFSVSGVQDGSDEVLVIGGFSVPLVNGASLTNTATPGGTYTVSVTNGVATVVFTPSATLTAAAAETLVRGVDYLNNASPLTEGDRTVSLVSLSDVNSTTPIAQSATGSVSVAVVEGVYAPAQPLALSLFDAAAVIAAIPTPTSGNDFKSVSFSLTGIADGAQEVFQVNGQDIPLVPGTVTVNGVAYSVALSVSGIYTVTVTDTAQPGFTEAALQAMVSGATLTNTSGTATEGVRTVTLGTILQGATGSNTGTDPVTLTGTAPTGNVVAPNTPVNAMAGDSVTVPTGSSVDSLTFTVTGVKDGAAEVLKFGAAPNIISVPLVTGTVTSTDPAGTYAVSVAANGTATVVFTPTVELTPAQANSLIAAATYTNTSNEPTGGVRSLDLTSMAVLTGSTVTPTVINNVGGDIAVQGTTEGAPVFDASDVLPTADLVGKTVDSMTFTVAGVKDGANEVLLVNGLAVPLVAGTVTSTSPAGTYVVTVNGSGTATVVFTPTTNLTEAQANALLEGVTYDNKSTDVTGGDRVVSLSSLVTTNPDGTGSATISPTTINGSLPVLEAPPEYVPLFNPTQVNAAIAAPTAGNDYKSISFDLTGIADGANEIFKVNGQNVPLVPGTMTLNGVTYTVTGSGTSYTVTVTDTVFPGFTESDLQTLVNGVVLINTDSTPTEGVRGVTIGTLEQGAAQVATVTLGGTEPVANVVTPNTPVNALAGDAVTVASGSTVDSLTFTVTGVADGASEVLKFGVSPNITSVPLVHGGSITSTDPAGTYAVSVISGTATVVFTPTTNLSAAATNALIAGATYTNTDTTPTEGVRSLSLTGMAVDTAGTVTQTSVSTVSGQIPVKASTTPLFDATAVSTAIPAVTSGNDFKSVSFDLTGIKDGAAEVFRVNGQDIPLVAGSVTVAGVNYTVTGTGPDYQVTVTDTIQPGFTEAALQTLVGGATLTNTATSPSEGARGVTLGAVTQGLTGTSTVTLTSAVNASVLAPDTPVRAMQGDTVVVDDATTSVDSLTFTVSGVKDGAAEVLKFGTTTVPLVSGTVTSTDPAGSFQVTVNEAGTATVVFRPTVNLTDAQTDTLIGAATYTNTSDSPTGGIRSLDLTSMDVQTTSGGALTATTVNGVGGVVPVQGVIEGESVFNSSAVVPNLTNGKTVDSLTFGVTGVKDGSNEVLVINGVTVPLVNSSAPISDGSGGSYSVVVTDGNAVVVYTPAANLTEAQANALLGGITYDNKASNVTDGVRGFSVISMDTVDANNVTTTTATPGLDSVVSYGDVTNTAPVVSVNAGVTVAENQTVTLSSSHLAVTDAEQNNLDLVFTLTDAVDRGQLFRDLNGNGLINAGEAMTAGSTFTQAELIGGRIKYRHDGSETRSDAFKFTVSDGIDTTAAQPFVINVTSVNDTPAGRPTIDGVIAQNAVLTASLASMSDGDGLPTSAGSFQYAWAADGQPVGTNASTYTLTAAEIDKKITVSVSYTDLAGFSHTVTSLATAPVVNVNDAPTLSASTLTVFEGGTITLTTSQIVAADQDGLTLDHQFKLMTAPTKGQIYLDVNGNGLLDSDDETVVAANGTFTQDDLFSGRVRYQHLGSEEGESFGLQVIDGDALASATATFTVTRTAVNDAPTFQNLDADVIAVPTAGVPVLLDRVATGLPAAVVADVDSTDLDGGQLRVAVNFNRNPAKDSLAIKQVGTGTGQISTSGSDVKFGTITIGTFAGGSGANDLLVTFNVSATKEAISALVSAITFQNDESIPAESVRTVAFTLTDGDGGTSDVARVTVNLEANGAPIFLNTNTSVAVFENNTQVGVFAATDPLRLVTTYSISSRDDSANADRAKFAINATTGVLTFVSAPDFETPTDAGTDNHYNVVVRATNANGYSEMPVEVAIIDQVTGTGEVAVDRTPPTYVMGTLSGNTVVLYFSEATSLNAVNKPDRSAFTVTAGNTAVAIAALAVNATAKTVTLTLAIALSSVTGLTVAYADPTGGNDTAALQDIAGNDTANFSVSNITLMTESGGGSGGSSGGAPHVAPTLESQVSTLAGASNVSGDGNGDGIADVNQSAVASLPFMMTRMPETVPDNSAMRWVTVVAGAVNGKVGANESTRITQIEQKDAPQNMSGQIEMPMGAIDFELSIATPGAATTMSTYVDADMSFNGYWVKNSNGIWTNLASAAFGGAMVEEAGKIRIDVNIQDGGEFDSDGLANGVIAETAFVGTIPLTLIGTYSELPDGQTWFGNIS